MNNEGLFKDWEGKGFIEPRNQWSRNRTNVWKQLQVIRYLFLPAYTKLFLMLINVRAGLPMLYEVLCRQSCGLWKETGQSGQSSISKWLPIVNKDSPGPGPLLSLFVTPHGEFQRVELSARPPPHTSHLSGRHSISAPLSVQQVSLDVAQVMYQTSHCPSRCHHLV